jgi:hypothetical protein
MFALLGLPILGPLLQGLFGFLNKFQDVAIEKIKSGTQINVEGMKASAQIIHDTQDDIGVRLTRDIIMFPVAIWTALISYDTIVVHDHPNWVFLTVEKYPPTLEYLPYAVITFLLGWTATKVFR